MHICNYRLVLKNRCEDFSLADWPLIYETNEGHLAYNLVSKDSPETLWFLTKYDKVFSAIRKYSDEILKISNVSKSIMQIEILFFVTEVWIAFYLNLISSRIFFADFSCPSKLFN